MTEKKKIRSSHSEVTASGKEYTFQLVNIAVHILIISLTLTRKESNDYFPPLDLAAPSLSLSQFYSCPMVRHHFCTFTFHLRYLLTSFSHPTLYLFESGRVSSCAQVSESKRMRQQEHRKITSLFPFSDSGPIKLATPGMSSANF